MKRITIVGTSVAGWHTLVALRSEGFDGEIAVVGREPHMPYDRPPLSKGVLRGDLTLADVEFGTSQQIEDLDAEWILGAEATGLNPQAGEIELSSGRRLRQDAVVIATGLQSPPHPLLDSPPQNVQELRSFDDARWAGETLKSAERIVVVGGGFIGSEIASAAHALGTEVVLLEAMPSLAGRALGPHAGLILQMHLEAGIDVRTSTSVRRVIGAPKFQAVECDDGTIVSGNAGFLGLGSVPANRWLCGSGLDLTGGVATDFAGRTSIPQVLVAGDLSYHESPWTTGRRRHEHWTSAVEQAAHVAKVLVGQEPVVGRAPYFWFELYENFIQVAGTLTGEHDTVEVHQHDSAGYLAVHRRADHIVGVIGINVQREFAQARRGMQPAQRQTHELR